MKNIIRFALVILTLGMLAACGDGDSTPVAIKQNALFGTTVGTFNVETDVLVPSELVLLDPDTGAYVRTIGSVGYIVNGLTHDDTNGKLYGTTSKNDPEFANRLIEINKSTGLGTPIGAGLGLPVLTPTVNSLGEMFGWADDGFDTIDDLVGIDKKTGIATIIGDTGLSTAESGLTFDNFDTLVLTSPVLEGTNVYSVDTAGSTAGAVNILTTFFDLPRAHHGDFHPDTNYYWGIDETDGSAGGAAERNLLVLDIATTAVIGTPLPTADYLHAIAFGYRYVFLSN